MEIICLFFSYQTILLRYHYFDTICYSYLVVDRKPFMKNEKSYMQNQTKNRLKENSMKMKQRTSIISTC